MRELALFFRENPSSSIENNSRNIKAVFFKLGTSNVHHKRNIMTPIMPFCHDNSYATGSLLITAKIPRFYLKQGSSTPTNLMERVKTIWKPCVFQAKPSGPIKKGCK